jgi:hypothetical protein
MKKILIAFLFAALAGCCGKSTSDSFNSSFRDSWRKSFIKTCRAEDTSAEKESYCTCVADRALQEMSVMELMNVGEAHKKIANDIAPKCK